MSTYTGGSYESAAAVTPNDSADLPTPALALQATVAGNINLVTHTGMTVVIPIAAGQIIPLRAKRVLATSTTATGIIAYW